jgi:type IV fimbrial biogenesis protein FimT
MISLRHAGFTVIELMIGLIVLGILMAMGIPSFARWIQSSQIRNSAEAIQSGLMFARTEAVRLNTRVRFQLVTTTTAACALADTGASWVVSLDDPAGACDSAASDTVAPRILQIRNSAEGSPNAVVNGNGQSQINFTGNGQASIAATINITNPTGGACATTPSGVMRCLNVTISTGGQIRMCDPARAANDPQGC